ncbi:MULTISPECIES: PD-(D/E)XK motif protein [unclassified Kribbella]|uniref:PD-(D/E)XK motif protein n=1 Tax=unclassified Kribbella TaxID=2644121 RepID=UPI0030188CC9
MTEGQELAASRHEPVELLHEYMQRNVNGTLIVEGSPEVRVKISPGENRLTLLVEMIGDDPGPDLLTRANLSYGASYESGKTWHCLDVILDGNLVEVYPVLCTVADRVQLSGEPFAAAVQSVLSGLSDILAGRKGLSREEQVGLFGELVVVLSLARQLGVSDALAAWRGPSSEEHDFGLQHVDLEVKTTMSERRRHWITSLTQLTPTAGRQLQLLSLQITSSALGDGASLADLVEVVRSLPGASLGHIDQTLSRLGWQEWYGDLYRERWRLRAEPAFFVVDDGFPALTLARVQAVMPNAERLAEVHYRIELDSLETDPPLFPVAISVTSNSEDQPDGR